MSVHLNFLFSLIRPLFAGLLSVMVTCKSCDNCDVYCDISDECKQKAVFKERKPSWSTLCCAVPDDDVLSLVDCE